MVDPGFSTSSSWAAAVTTSGSSSRAATVTTSGFSTFSSWAAAVTASGSGSWATAVTTAGFSTFGSWAATVTTSGFSTSSSWAAAVTSFSTSFSFCSVLSLSVSSQMSRETRAPHASQPHLNLNDGSFGYKPRISQRELECLSVEERNKRRKDIRNHHQRRRRELSKEKAKEKAAAYGDITHRRRFDKTAEYSRMAATKRRLEENYNFSPTDTLLASDEMGGLFCFYLHFSLSVALPEDLDEQPNGVAALIERLRAAYPCKDNGKTFHTVGLIDFVYRKVLESAEHVSNGNYQRSDALACIAKPHCQRMFRDWKSVLRDPALWVGNVRDLRVSTVEQLTADIASFCPALRRNRQALDEVQIGIKEGILPLAIEASA
ncbi:hypothetical protein FN846DRAFT_896012 [Sphaerosporella brunnea]|uniref:Uncharacterized protein n=1 Tax=Sphaerosporella brunnea TaxID=1250544 RepID=A0A5J5EEK1_9PEZI|nr:hypothetical protein FN846DRAFT_896012 [Sphaerosporella brunnea]